MAYHHRDIAEEIEALTERYRGGEFSEAVFRASLKTRLPPDEINEIVRLNQPPINPRSNYHG